MTHFFMQNFFRRRIRSQFRRWLQKASGWRHIIR